MNRLPGALLLLALSLAGAQADETVWVSERGLFDLGFVSELDPLQINKLHSWTLHLEDAGGAPVAGAKIEVNGGMPQHDHGLPTRPRVTRELGNGDYQLEGLRFHMRGEWEIKFTIEAAGKTDTVTVRFAL